MWLVSSLLPLCVHSCKCVPGDTFSLRQGTYWLGHRESACPSSPQCWDYKRAHYHAWLFFCMSWGLNMCPHTLPTGLSPQSPSASCHALAAVCVSSLWAFTLTSCHQALKFQGQILHMRKFKWSNVPLCPCWSQLMPKGTSEAVDHHENNCHLEEAQCSSSGSRSPR